MKRLVSYFIKFPIAVNLIMILVFVFGYVGMTTVKSTFFPNNQLQFIYIDAVYVGASPEEVEEGVILKIEDNLKGISGVDRITSVAQENMGKVTVEFDNGIDLDEALIEVKNAVEKIPSFPKEVESVISYKHEGKNFTMNLAFTGHDVSLKALKETARKVERDLMKNEGISKITLSGFPEEEIAVLLDQDKMESYQISFEQVASAISKNNLNLTGGSIKDGEEEFYIRSKSKNYYAEGLDNIVVKYNKSNSVVRLKDVATIKDQWEDSPSTAIVNGERGVLITVDNTFDEDVLATAEFVRNYIAAFNEENEVLKGTVVYDLSDVLSQRLNLLVDNGVIGIALVFIFLSLFLNPRIAFWVAAGIPFSIFGMFVMLPFTTVTINMISLFALIVVLGILVDDAIVIAENIYQHHEKGKKPIQAAIDGTMEVLPAVLSAVFTTMMAFSVFFFLDGNLGDFFSDLSLIIIIILMVSLVEGIIILPAHIAHSKALKEGTQKNKLITWTEESMKWIRDTFYAPVLKFVLKNKAFTLSIVTALFIFSIGMIAGKIVPVTFFPHVEGDDITISLEMTNGTSEEVTQKWIDYIDDKVREVNEEFRPQQPQEVDIIESVYMQLMPNGSSATIMMTLVGPDERVGQTFEVIASLKEKIGVIPGAETMQFKAFSPFGTPIEISLRGDDLEMLKSVKEELKREMKKYPELRDVSDNSPVGSREISIQLKDKAHLLGVTEFDIINQVRQGFFGYEVQRLQRGQDEVKVWVRYDDENRSSFGNLEDLKIRLADGSVYPLQELADIQTDYGYSGIYHIDQQREVKVTSDLTDPDASVPDLMKRINEEILDDIVKENPGLEVNYDGQNREKNKVMKSAKIALPVVVVLMLAIVIFTLRSVTQSLLIFGMVPLSFIGVVAGHYLHGHPLNMVSFLGIIALVGVLINDALVLINALNLNLKEGMSYQDALIDAGMSRFRPILLTTLTTIAGMTPMIFETSMQARFLIPMVLSISYGIAMATTITLFILPVMLSIINSAKVKWTWLKTGKTPSPEEVESAVKEIKLEEEYYEII